MTCPGCGATLSTDLGGYVMCWACRARYDVEVRPCPACGGALSYMSAAGYFCRSCARVWPADYEQPQQDRQLNEVSR